MLLYGFFLCSSAAAAAPTIGRRVVLSGSAAAAAAAVVTTSPAEAVTTSRESVVLDLLSRVPAYVVANSEGSPYLTEVGSDGKRYGSVFLGPRDAADVLRDVQTYDKTATLVVVPLATVYNDIAKTAADAADARQIAPQPRGSTSRDMRLFLLRPLSDETENTNAVSLIPGASLLPGVTLFYEPTLFLGATEAERVRPYFFRLADLNTVWRQGEGDDRNWGQISPSLRVLSLEGLIQKVINGGADVPPLLLPPSETAELSYR